MKLFPKRNFTAELSEINSIAMGELKRNTDITDSLISDWTKKAFRGQVNENGFKIISSEIGHGAICVLNGKFDGKTGEIEVRIHKAFKIMFSILMLIPIIGFVIIALTNGIKESFGIIIPLIVLIVFVRFIFMELSFRFVSKTGLNKLTRIIGITKLEKKQNN
ncbi:hypothetical protein KO500_08275 [Cellulophaga baltica]|uniref:hypothetical protein n=1 Tax=Cellulophaga TaxID=104264 RepID=UPI001C07319D|nr:MULTISPECIES: hypothetical protein [Cellulophaga]MBU2996428.1 hypothetical protein [Cellulophaga baltica]MDO6767823.1 hypothetical protein [Cellulophaga sp. 1_MG-2023]